MARHAAKTSFVAWAFLPQIGHLMACRLLLLELSMVDQLVCFNEHNETSKGNEKHRVPSWQWYFKGAVCSESCAGTYLTNKSCPAPSESVSPVNPVRRNRECRRFPTRVGSVSAVCGMFSLRVSMQDHASGWWMCNRWKSGRDLPAIRAADGNIPLMTCVCSMAKANSKLLSCFFS